MTEKPENEDHDAHDTHDADDDEEGRAFILARRARFVAAALAGAGLITAACGGETNDKGDGGNPQPCLSPVMTGGMTGTGGFAVCLSAPMGGAGGFGGMQPTTGGYTSTGGYVATGGTPQVCLSPPMTGGYPNTGGIPQPCLGVPLTGGSPGTGGISMAVDAGADAAPPTGGTGGMPLPCLSPPPFAKDPEK